MKRPNFRRLVQSLRGAAAAATVIGVLAGTASGAFAASEPDVFALTNANQLLRFNESRPDRILSTVSISGLQSNERVLGIDFRPLTGELYAVGSSNRLYTVDPSSGMAQQVGSSTFAVALDFDKEIGVDFNPQADRLRIVTDKGQNLRVVPRLGMANDGAVVDGDAMTAGVQPDKPLNFMKGDRNSGTPNAVGAAYINNVANAQSTVLYNIDSDRDILVTQTPPNDGVLNTVGKLGVNASDVVGFDIFTDEDGDNGRAAIRKGNSNSSQFYTTDLTSGKAKMKDKGTIGGGQVVRDIAVDIR